MSHDDQVCLKLGREVARMIRELVETVPSTDTGYTRREFTFPGGSVHLFIARNAEVADTFEKAAAEKFTVVDQTPPSQVN